ncbi:SDR family NAD(P)-dependent oxidoreductase [Actinoplanes octamycinicus]|nr:SDR family oxidoreductase [Actinoplanes octamycinicus]
MTGKSVVVVGGSRGFGLGVVRAARAAGARVTTVARTSGLAGDATDEAFADQVLAGTRPELLVVTAGAVPEMRPLSGHTWESFSVGWHQDVRIAFGWLRAALRLPLPAGARVVVFGSAAELRGSPLSGGYAGAKATVRMITGYAAAEGRDLGIGMTAVLPGLTPGTGVGETAIRAYAEASGVSRDEFAGRLTATADSVGAAVLGLPASGLADAYLIGADGLRPLSG